MSVSTRTREPKQLDPAVFPPSVLVRNQKKTYGPKSIDYYGTPADIIATVRHDDECSNGHNSFSITCSIYRQGMRSDRAFLAGGCCHEEVAAHFPELAPFIKWHLIGTDGPMHYPDNVTYFAGDRDCWGRAPGDPSRYEYGLQFNDVPVTHRIDADLWNWLNSPDVNVRDLRVVEIAYPPGKPGDCQYHPRYTYAGFLESNEKYRGSPWAHCPFRGKVAAVELAEAFKSCRYAFTRVIVERSEGKPRELDSARHCAVWPDATDDDLTAPGLSDRLMARLPALMRDFKSAVESLGFVY